jgi:hypothetical protein
LAGLAIGQQSDDVHGTIALKELPHLVNGRGEGEIADIDIPTTPFILDLIATPL